MQLQKIEQPINYEEVLTEIVENCVGDEIMPFVRCLKFPFKFCEKLLNKKGISWKTKVEIAKRNDCPESVLVKLCKRNGERFLRAFLYSLERNDCSETSPMRKQISDVVVDTILTKPCGLDMLCIHPVRFTENAQEKIINQCFGYKICGSGYSFTHYLFDFIRSQDTIPQHCIARISEAMDKDREKRLRVLDDYEESHFKRQKKMLGCMKTPVDEGLCIEVVENYEKEHDKPCLRKVASNPSISKYVEMLLSMKFSHDEEIALCMKRSEDDRNAWRQEHDK